MSASKSLDEQLLIAERQKEELERQIRLMRAIQDHLIDEAGQPISTHLDFEFGEMKITIRPIKARPIVEDLPKVKGKRTRTKKSKVPNKDLTADLIQKISTLSLTGKKGEIINALVGAKIGFEPAHWASFVDTFKNKRQLTGSGQGAGMIWVLVAS